MESAKKTARIAGLLYLIIAITGAFGIMYVPTKLFVSDDINLTAKNILDNELLFRFGIFSNLICQTVFVFLALTLYNLFKNVNGHLARTLVALVIVGVPIAFFIIFNEYYILLILKENFMNNFPSIQQNALAMLSLKMYGNGNVIIGIFWGLWLIPFGQLSYQSGFIPKILGVLLILGGLCYLIDTTAFILFTEYHSITGILVGITSATAEFAMVGWLLIKGVKTKK
ncbi:DUF4386 domain-containing protein [Flavobacterium sp. ENC]|uniref:DUF4386 domain-containing protein n=1 Tax=Flavobacterium sp. ENC TaxID=2897330 RepID=UPI001E406DD7|nr:DUF4386 domain-containing protein [Flavobacterium sp. ENC]MCD0465800.1 DUF4386 domain-containing protein [Flavobacterium sp. ENC]